MIAATWSRTLGSDRQLYDGQHRLWAVVHYGRTVPMLVVSGLSKEARATIDHGRSRSVADQLRILDQEQNSTRLVQWFCVIELLHGTLQRQLSVAIARERRETLSGRGRLVGDGAAEEAGEQLGRSAPMCGFVSMWPRSPSSAAGTNRAIQR